MDQSLFVVPGFQGAEVEVVLVVVCLFQKNLLMGLPWTGKLVEGLDQETEVEEDLLEAEEGFSLHLKDSVVDVADFKNMTGMLYGNKIIEPKYKFIQRLLQKSA